MTNEEKATEELEKLEFAASEREYAAILERALKLDPDNLEARLFKLDPGIANLFMNSQEGFGDTQERQ